MATDDAVLVGSGINALVVAALLAQAGWQVQALEPNDRLGGAIQTTKITVPGFQHNPGSGLDTAPALRRRRAA
jgi:phytoene dehydrogenase-like protein